jgi:hypothetical protein
VGALLLRVFIVPLLYEAMAAVFERKGGRALAQEGGCQ